jgi:hypothetical protein
MQTRQIKYQVAIILISRKIVTAHSHFSRIKFADISKDSDAIHSPLADAQEKKHSL